MYVENGKISKRQIYRLYVFDLMGIATLLLPPYLAGTCGMDGILAILIGTAAALIYLLYLGWAMKQMDCDLQEKLHTDIPSVFRWGIIVAVLIHAIVTAGFSAYVFTELMQYSLVKGVSYEWILAIILVISAYAISGGIESRARVYEVLFFFVLVPYLCMMLLAVKNFQWVHVQDLLLTTEADLGKGSYLVFLFFTPLFYILFQKRDRGERAGKSVVNSVMAAVLTAAILLLGSYIILAGNFGVKALASMQYPIVTLMSTIRFEGTFLKRMDALMLAVWFYTLYALLNMHLHYASAMMEETACGKKKTARIIIPALLTFAVAWAMKRISAFIGLFMDYYTCLAVPLMLLIPLAAVVSGNLKKQNTKGGIVYADYDENEDGNMERSSCDGNADRLQQ